MNTTRTRDCTTTTEHDPNGTRYQFDFSLLKLGWQQWDTDQDASYFGIWVHPTDLKVLTFAEGDITLQEFTNAAAYETELNRMSEHYGPVPPAFISITPGESVTEHYAPRPMQAEPELVLA